MPVIAGATSTEANLNDTTPASPAGGINVKFQAGAPAVDPNDPNFEVRDISAYVPLDIDGTLAADSDNKVASQKATKTYVDTGLATKVTGPGSATDSDFVQFDGTTGKLVKDGGISLDVDGTMAADSDSRVPSQKAVVTYVAAHSGSGTGTVTHTAGALTAGELVIGNGGADVTVGDLTGDVTTSSTTATTLAKIQGTTVTGTTGTGKAVLDASPALSGNPTATTQTSGDNSTKVATTAFVTTAINNAIAGVNPAVAVQAATAAVLPNSPTYSNGVGGIGATLTAGVTNTALVVDGYTPALNGRILVKNQASAFQNGVYFVSQIAALGLAWILTRALDYDQPSDMNNTGAIPVVNGTVNTDTSWVQTSQVTTVGTDAVTFTQFSLNPTTIVVGPASAVASDFAQFDGTSGKLIKDGGLSLDTDGTLAANSDLRIASQKAVKTYVNSFAPGGSGSLTLKTNGVTNGSQALLDFLQGLGITITDDGSGHVTFRAKSYTLDVQQPTGNLTGNSADQPVFTTTIPAAALVVGSMVRISWGITRTVATVSLTSKVFFGATSFTIESASASTGLEMGQALAIVTGSSAQIFSGWNAKANQFTVAPAAFVSPAEAISGTIAVKVTMNTTNTSTLRGIFWLVEIVNP